MRYAAVFIVLAVFHAALGQEKPLGMTVAEIVKRDRWSVAQGKHHDKPLVVRFRDEFRSRPDISAFPERLIITWRYQPDNSGLPSSGQSASMETFEDGVVGALEHDDAAVLTAVITNDGTRQWIFYTGDVPLCKQRIDAQHRRAPYPIDLAAEDDPHWSFFYENILEGMRQ